MAIIVRLVLSVFVGGAIGLLLLMVTSESLFMLITAGLAGLLVGGLVYGVAGGRKGLGGLAGLAIGIVVLFLYAELLGYINDEVESMILAMSGFFAPYVAATFLFSLVSETESGKSDGEGKTE